MYLLLGKTDGSPWIFICHRWLTDRVARLSRARLIRLFVLSGADAHRVFPANRLSIGHVRALSVARSTGELFILLLALEKGNYLMQKIYLSSMFLCLCGRVAWNIKQVGHRSVSRAVLHKETSVEIRYVENDTTINVPHRNPNFQARGDFDQLAVAPPLSTAYT